MYEVKYGQWCQKDGKRYWTGTKEDLLLAKQAGQVSDSDRVIVHARTRALGEMTMSVLPALPGFLLCDGSQFDKEVFKDLYEALGDDHTPDLREAAPAGAGQRAAGVAEHDVFSLGEFKDDQAQQHVHTRGTMEITGTLNTLSRSAAYGAFYAGDFQYRWHCDCDDWKNDPRDFHFAASRTWTGETSYPQAKSTSYDLVASPSGNPAAKGWYEAQAVLQNTADTTVSGGKQYYDASGNAVANPLASVNPAALGWYEEMPGTPDTYVPTTDTTAKALTTYYDASGNVVYMPSNTEDTSIDPSALGWCVKVPGTSAGFQRTADTSYDLSKTYYTAPDEDSVADPYSIVNPHALGWKEVASVNYVLTADTSVVPGKEYYEKNEASSVARTGNVTRGKRFGVNFFIAY